MSTFTLRPTCREDLTYIKRLNYLTEVFGDETQDPHDTFVENNEFYLDQWDPHNGGFIAFDEHGIPAGGVWLIDGDNDIHGTGYVHKDVPELAIAVEKRYQRQGLSKMLLDAAIQLCRDTNHPAVSLCVHDNNPGARKAYEKKGFVEHSYDPERQYTTMYLRV